MAKVLFADDSITVRKVAERLLTEAGLEVSVASTGEEAVMMLDAERPDLVITDVIMPDKSGYDVCTYVRSHATLSGTPVLLISGVVTDDVTRQAESCQANGVLKKPFQGTVLQDRVLELLDTRHAGEEGTDTSRSAFRLVSKPAGSGAEETPAAALAAEDEAMPSGQAAALSQGARADGIRPPAAPVGFDTAEGKVYRITQEQLETFRQAIAKIRELEGALAAERKRNAGLGKTAGGSALDAERISELERILAAEREAKAEQSTLARQATERVSELEAELRRERDRMAQEAPGGAEDGRVAELERVVKEEQAVSADLRAKVQALEQASERQAKKLQEADSVLRDIGRLAGQAVAETSGAGDESIIPEQATEDRVRPA